MEVDSGECETSETCETEEDSAPEASVSPEGPALPSNSREMRNRAEKMRRDKLNSFIGELATLVPMIARSAKRMDKTSILRLTATHIRLNQTLNKEAGRLTIPSFIDQYILEQLVCEQLGGFLLVMTPAGKIIFVSFTVENLLGHQQTDLMGQSVFTITAPDDHDLLRLYISTESNLDNEWKKYFNIHLKRAGPRTESPVYEPVRIMGISRRAGQDSASSSSKAGSDSDSGCSSTSKEVVPATTINRDVVLLFVKIYRPEPLAERLSEIIKDQYVTRHLIDGRIVNCDQRISFVSGYMTEEVAGLSAFKFMHRDDVRWVMIALRQMYDRGESKGSSCYRLLSRNGQFIYLRTFGFLEIDSKGTVESFVCINTLVTEAEGMHLINDMKRRFSALINAEASPLSVESESSIESVEDPQQVDAAIMHLITNLPSPGSDHRSTPSPPRPSSNQVNENQDCPQNSSPTAAAATATTTESNPAVAAAAVATTTATPTIRPIPYHMKLKTAPKRPPSTEIEANLYKRQRTSPAPPQLSPLPTLSPYQSRPQIVELPRQPDQPMYQHEQRHLNNVKKELCN